MKKDNDYDYINDDIYQDKITDGYINIPYSNIFIQSNVNHYDAYDDNFDNNNKNNNID